jgi:hypothetical protein
LSLGVYRFERTRWQVRKMDDDKEKKDDRAFQYYLRLNRIFMLALLVLSASIVAWRPTAPRVAGLILATAVFILAFFVNRVSSRRFGFGILAVAGIFAVAGEFAGVGWGMEPYEFGIEAVTLGALALGWIFTNKKTGEANVQMEDGVGVFVFVSLLVVAGIVVWLGTPSIAHPAGLVFLEALGALADVAGDRWKKRLALVAIFPIAGLVADQAKPEWRRLTLYGLHSSYTLLRSHSHMWMVWPILFGGLSNLVASLNRRRAWRPALVRLTGIVTAI